MADESPEPHIAPEEETVDFPPSPASNSSMAPAGEALKDEQDILITKYVQACQAGDIATVRDLIGSGAIDVGEDCDSNGVSGLHWAAINNRLSIVRYLVEQGAPVDKAGGDLSATPLHWACRYGLVYIVDYLTRNGADPSKTDAQGFNALHLAVHSSNIMLVIYVLTFLDCTIDLPDPNGRTALHWAAYQGDSLTVGVLLDFKASVKPADSEGFTPLHWALIRGTKDCLTKLIEAGSDITAITNEGKSCFDIARDMNSSGPLASAFYEAGFQADGTPLYKPLNERQAKVLTFFLPYPTLGVLFKIASDSHPLVTAISIAATMLVLQRALTKYIFPCYNRSPNAFLTSPILAGIFSASTFWIIIVWLTTLFPATAYDAPFSNFLFLLLTTSVVYSFQRSMFRNPGIIERPDSNTEIQETIQDLLKLGLYDAKHFCIYTFVRKPIRSKYSYFLKHVVARFDHTCPWVYNDVGLRNHKSFLFFVISLELAIITLFRIVAEYFDTFDDDNLECLIWEDELCAGYTYARFTFLLTAWAGFQLIWVTFLLFSQCFQIAKGLTTVELSQLTSSGDRDANAYYSSTPPELMGGTTANSTMNQGRSGHSHKNCLTTFCLITGLNQFVIALKQSIGIKDNTSITAIPADYGVKQNCIDFWFAAGDDHLDVRNFFKLPVKDEATLNGITVNYYKLYELPEKRPAYDAGEV